MNANETYIKRCIELAQNGLGTTYPNPMVGCVIVYNNTIIGEGWHKKAGEAHAEVIAINAVKDKSLLQKATLYVSLEPCSHYGKTPPCSNLIVENKIPKVVIGTLDPNIKVAGNGIKKLKEAGVEVILGVHEAECNELNKRFFSFHQKQRPYIILKWAETEDGFIAPKERIENKPVWITNQYARQLVHKWRAEEQAILVGTQTVIDDNPRLDIRNWVGQNPIRIILDQTNRIPKNYNIFDKETKTILLTRANAYPEIENVVVETIDFNTNLPYEIASTLFRHQIQSVIIEGGSQTLQTFINSNLWDEARVFVGKTKFETGTKAPLIKKNPINSTKIDTDELIIYHNLDLN